MEDVNVTDDYYDFLNHLSDLNSSNLSKNLDESSDESESEEEAV